MRNLKNIVLTALVFGFTFSCSNYLEPSVDQNITTDQAAKSVKDLNALVLGTLDRMNGVALYGRDMYVSADVMSDNAFSNQNSGRFVLQSAFNNLEGHAFPADVWAASYAAIANANIVIHTGLSSSADVDYVRGRALALRALNHLNLLLWFGQQYVTGGSLGVPYVETYAEGGESNYPARLTAAETWTKIKADLADAASLMKAAIATTPSLDVGVAYMNYAAVKGLQSRVFLFTKDFADAITAANEVITLKGGTGDGTDALLAPGAFFAAWTSGTGPNSLFEAAFTSTDRLGTDNIARIYRDSNYGDIEATQDLYDAYEAGDIRKTLMQQGPFAGPSGGDYRMMSKYSDELGTDNTRVLRYAEVLLNKAEALAQSTATQSQAKDLINAINVKRGGSGPYTTGSVDEVLAERRLELAFEGQRLFDLARNGKSIPLKGGLGGTRGVTGATTTLPFGDYRYALPIPLSEMNANSRMVQNKTTN